MSAIFISHSSTDDDEAARIAAWLEALGHRSVFLDFDPANGIPAGRSWEEDLYEQLRSCRAVIVLCSRKSLESRWCFAEYTHARSLGKHVFPVRIEECEVDSLLLDRQLVDLAADREAGLARLERGLLAAGVQATDPYDWDNSRPPYPGMTAFQEKDAAVYFGREQDIGVALDQLNRVQRFRNSHILLILGASGSGKSSLVLAGMLPRLRRDPDRWLVVEPFRPGEVPFLTLSGAIDQTFQQLGMEQEPGAVLTRLFATPVTDATASSATLSDLAKDLANGTGQDEASVLLIIDQFEELLGRPADHECSRFLETLSRLQGSRIVVLATMRSDFLGVLQQHPSMATVDPASVSLSAISQQGIVSIIEKPAALVGVGIETGLVPLICSEVETEDALPLLAFTLRELYEGYSSDGTLRITEYRDHLGGLRGSVARASDAVMSACKLSPSQENSLRGVFLAMVRVTVDGQYARRSVRWDQVNPELRPALERFVEARLLVSREEGGVPTLEVAHEALFRAWRKLQRWLDEGQEALLLREEVARAADEWQAGDRHDDYLLRRGRLARALELRDEGLLPLEEGELSFLEASHRSNERFERRRRFRRNGVMVASLLLAAIMAYLTFDARKNERLAQYSNLITASDNERATDPMLASMLALEAVEIDPERSEAHRALLDSLARTRRTEELRRKELLQATLSADGSRVLTVSEDGVMVRTLQHAIENRSGVQLDARIALTPTPTEDDDAMASTFASADWSPDGERILTLEADGKARIWDLEGHLLRPAFSAHDDGVAADWNPRRRRLLTVGYSGGAVWDDQGSLLRELPGAASLGAWSPNGELALTRSSQGAILLWDHDGRPAGRLETASETFQYAAWSPSSDRIVAIGFTNNMSSSNAWVFDLERVHQVLRDGHAAQLTHAAFDPSATGRILTTSEDHTAVVWSPQGHQLLILAGHEGPVEHAAWSEDGLRILTASSDRKARVFDSSSGQLIHLLEGHQDPVQWGAWSFDGERVLTKAADNTARIWELRGNLLALFEEKAAIAHGAWSPDRERVLTASRDGTARIHDRESNSSKTLVGHQDQVLYGSWSKPDGRSALTASQDGTARLWSLEGEQLAELSGHEESVSLAEFSPSGSLILTVSDDNDGRLWDREGSPIATLEGHLEQIYHGAWSPNGEHILTTSRDQTARIWSLQGVHLNTLQHDAAVRYGEWHPSGDTLLTVSDDGLAQLWNLRGEEVRTIKAHDEEVLHANWSPDGARFLTVSEDGTCIVWTMNGDREAVLEGHAGAIYHGEWSPRGNQILTVSADKTLRIWEPGGKIVAIHRGHEGEVSFGAWSRPFGRMVLTVSFDQTARIWPPYDLAELAKRLITRDFTAEERRRYIDLETKQD